MIKKLKALSKELLFLKCKKQADQIILLAQLHNIKPDYEPDSWFGDSEVLESDLPETREYDLEQPIPFAPPSDSAIITMEEGAKAFMASMNDPKEILMNALGRRIINFLKNVALSGEVRQDIKRDLVKDAFKYSVMDNEFVIANENILSPSELKAIILRTISYIGNFVNIGNIYKKDFSEKERSIERGVLERVERNDPQALFIEQSPKDFSLNRLYSVIMAANTLLEEYSQNYR